MQYRDKIIVYKFQFYCKKGVWQRVCYIYLIVRLFSTERISDILIHCRILIFRMQALQPFFCLVFGTRVINSQNMNPAVIVSKENGETTSKMAYIGFLGCGYNSSTSESVPINSLEMKVNHLEAVIQTYASFILNLSRQNGILENKLELINQNYEKSNKRVEDLEKIVSQQDLIIKGYENVTAKQAKDIAKMNSEILNLYRNIQNLSSSTVELQNSTNGPGIGLFLWRLAW